MRIAIHQPNFIAWMPYFQKIQESDAFVFLGHCQYEKGNYQNRFNVGDKWHTMQVSKGKLKDTILEKQYKDLTRRDVTPGKKFVMDVLSTTAKTTATTYATKYAAKGVESLIKKSAKS